MLRLYIESGYKAANIRMKEHDMSNAMPSNFCAALIAAATSTLFIGLRLLVPPGRYEIDGATVEVNTISLSVAAIALIGLALAARFSARTIWTRLAIIGSAGLLAMTGLHFAVFAIVCRVMGG